MYLAVPESLQCKHPPVPYTCVRTYDILCAVLMCLNIHFIL